MNQINRNKKKNQKKQRRDFFFVCVCVLGVGWEEVVTLRNFDKSINFSCSCLCVFVSLEIVVVVLVNIIYLKKKFNNYNKSFEPLKKTTKNPYLVINIQTKFY